MNHPPKSTAAFGAICLAVALALTAPSAFALKYAAPEHKLKVDPKMPGWTPGELKIEPEEELNLVGADVMDRAADEFIAV